MPTWTELPHAFFAVLGVCLGAILASFGNVVIYRLPRGQSLIRPASTCPNCGARIRPYDNVPIVSWLLLRGRARCCKAKISPRYVLLEVIGAALGFALTETTLARLPADLPAWHYSLLLFLYLLLGLGLICLAFIDLEHMILPDELTLGGTVLGLVTVALRPEITFVESALGAAIGFVAIWLPFDVLYKKLRGHPGMGLGDAKLVLLAGAWFGWLGALFTLLAGAVQGTLVTLAVYAATGKVEEPEAIRTERQELLSMIEKAEGEERIALEKHLQEDFVLQAPAEGLARARVPFGPFLAIALLEYLLIGPELVGWYLSLSGFS